MYRMSSNPNTDPNTDPNTNPYKLINSLVPKQYTLDDINLINNVKNLGLIIPSPIIPTIFSRLDSLNFSMAQPGVTYKSQDYYYYYLVENITENNIGCYTSITSDLKEPYIIELKAFSYSNPKTITTYPPQYGLSQIVCANYNKVNTASFLKGDKIFEPFEDEFYNMNFNEFIDQYTNLTSFVNNKTSNEQKLYTLLFLAKSSSVIGGSGNWF